MRSAREFGFGKAELAEVRADLMRQLDEAVRRESTSPSGNLLMSILAAAEGQIVPTDPTAEREVHGAILESLTVEDCQKALQESWSAGTLSHVAIGSVEFEDAGQAMGSVYDKAMEVELAAPVLEERSRSPMQARVWSIRPWSASARSKDLGLSPIQSKTTCS